MHSFLRFAKEHREWLPRAELMVARKIVHLESDLDDGSLDGLVRATASLSFLSLYYGARGVVAVRESNGGFEDIHRALLYRFWEVKVRVAAASKRQFLNGIVSGSSLSNHLPVASNLLLAFISFGDYERALEMEGAVKLMLGRDGSPGDKDRHAKRLALFALWVQDKCSKSGTISHGTDDIRELGFYSGVAQAWGTSAVAELVPKLVGYHVSQVDDGGEAQIPIFKWAPFDFVPLEILAIININSKLGVDFSVNKELLDLLASMKEYQVGTGQVDRYVERLNDLFSTYFS